MEEYFTDETQAICESANSERVVKFEKIVNFAPHVQWLSKNGELFGVYYDESGNVIAQDIHGDTHPAYLTGDYSLFDEDDFISSPPQDQFVNHLRLHLRNNP